MRIRPVADADLPALSELAKRTWRDTFGESVSVEDSADELEGTRSERYFRSALRTDTILVAVDQGELVGYVQFGDVRIPEVDPLYESFGSRTVGTTRVTIGSNEVGEDLVMELARP